MDLKNERKGVEKYEKGYNEKQAERNRSEQASHWQATLISRQNASTRNQRQQAYAKGDT